MIKLVTSRQIRKHESEWIKKNGPGYSLELMEKAGKALAEVAKQYRGPYLFICGKGNNGGDGFVAARYLHECGKKVFVFLTTDEEQLSTDAKTNFKSIKDRVIWSKLEKTNDKEFSRVLSSSNTVVECLLGTGVSGKLNELYNWIIKTINNTNKTIISCDIPTGINPETGNVPNGAVKANITVTFGFTKLGLLVYPAKKYAGMIKTVDIGLPDIDTNMFLLDDDFLKENFPKRLEDANKGNFGKTLLVCGSKKYPGAALLASRAASSIGSGLTSLSSPEEVFSEITTAIPEVTHTDFILSSILEESKSSSALVIGPGLTTERNVAKLVEGILLDADIPIILDADGINIFAGRKEIIKKAKNEVVITPHPKELARLLQKSTEEVLRDRINLVRNTALELSCIVVLKGPATIIGTKSGELYVSPFANAALAKGGTGDVLSGFIGGLIAQKLDPKIAACVGVYVHGKVGELVSKDKTVFSLLPQDLIAYLPKAIRELT